MKIGGQTLHHRLAPAQSLLLLHDSAAHVPVEQEQFTVGGPCSRDPDGLDARLEGMEPGGLIGGG
jgi:hypothetical protein